MKPEDENAAATPSYFRWTSTQQVFAQPTACEPFRRWTPKKEESR